MLIKLHSQATTTPKVRAAIQASDEPAWVLAERHGTTEQTVWKWRKRDTVEDREIARLNWRDRERPCSRSLGHRPSCVNLKFIELTRQGRQ